MGRDHVRVPTVLSAIGSGGGGGGTGASIDIFWIGFRWWGTWIEISWKGIDGTRGWEELGDVEGDRGNETVSDDGREEHG